MRNRHITVVSVVGFALAVPSAAGAASAPQDLSGTHCAPPGYFYTHSPEAGGGWADAAMLSRGLKQLDPASSAAGGGWADLAKVQSTVTKRKQARKRSSRR